MNFCEKFVFPTSHAAYILVSKKEQIPLVVDYIDCGSPPNSNILVGSNSVSVGAVNAGSIHLRS